MGRPSPGSHPMIASAHPLRRVVQTILRPVDARGGHRSVRGGLPFARRCVRRLLRSGPGRTTARRPHIPPWRELARGLPARSLPPRAKSGESSLTLTGEAAPGVGLTGQSDRSHLPRAPRPGCWRRGARSTESHRFPSLRTDGRPRLPTHREDCAPIESAGEEFVSWRWAHLAADDGNDNPFWPHRDDRFGPTPGCDQLVWAPPVADVVTRRR